MRKLNTYIKTIFEREFIEMMLSQASMNHEVSWRLLQSQ